jgi:signal transduction histidine kinase
MRRASWACWIASACLALLAWAACAAGPPAAGSDTLLDTARATLAPTGLPATDRVLKLPHRWDSAYPRDDGRVLYRMELPPAVSREPFALFFPRVGNQVEVRVRGEIVARLGALGDPSTDAAKGPVWISVPAALVDPRQPTPLEIEITTQAGRWGGLSVVHFGPETAVRPAYRSNYRWRQTASVVIVLGLALMGVIAAGLWWRQRDGLYGMFALIAFFGIVRMGDRLLFTPPLPWPLWGGVAAVAFTAHLLLMARFALEMVGENRRWVRAGFWAYLGLGAAGALLSFLGRWPLLWTLVLASLTLPGAVVLYQVARHTWRKPARESLLMCIAGFVVILAGVRDLLVVRLADGGSLAFSILPHAVFVLVLIMGWIIVERYSHQVSQYRELNASLERRIAERETQLGASYEQLQRQSEQQATLQERQRIMRDIHDGVGAQLVGLLSLLKKGGVRPDALQEHANAALDELRMAVDSLQPVHGDLTTVLAALRYRLQPRLEAAGLEVVWDVEELPLLESLTPTTVLQIQRILLEAFTNVLRHAGATSVRIHARRVDGPPRLLLQVDDNGIGLPPLAARAQGHGLRNMKARAAAIGAAHAFLAGPQGGTRVQLELPLG